MALGGWALFGFFGLSGYLITRSRLSGQPVRNFYLARFLRIIPSHVVVCLLVAAFAFAPLSTMLGDGREYSLGSAVGFVVRNFVLYPPVLAQPGISGTLAEVPFHGYWHGPLWTLFFEAAAYLMIGVMASIFPKRLLPYAVSAVFLVTTALSLSGAFGLVSESNPNIAKWMPLFIAFAAGSLLFLHGNKIASGLPTTTGAGAALVALSVVGLVPQLGCLLLAHLLIRLGIALPLQRVGSKYDISYGTYIYGWPVQQYLALVFRDTLPVAVFIFLSLAAAAVLAALSCVLIEMPALKLKAPQRIAVAARRHMPTHV